MYREENGQIVLTMSPNDHQYLVFCLGIAWTKVDSDEHIKFVNRLLEGCPGYIPYETK